jgi:hypothetical protein
LGLPIVASGIKVILESCKLAKAESEKIESSNLIVLTLSNKVRKFWATPSEEFAVVSEPLSGEVAAFPDEINS